MIVKERTLFWGQEVFVTFIVLIYVTWTLESKRHDKSVGYQLWDCDRERHQRIVGVSSILRSVDRSVGFRVRAGATSVGVAFWVLVFSPGVIISRLRLRKLIENLVLPLITSFFWFPKVSPDPKAQD